VHRSPPIYRTHPVPLRVLDFIFEPPLEEKEVYEEGEELSFHFCI